MSCQDNVADLLTRIRNGHAARKSSVEAPAFKLNLAILDVLQREGYIRGYQTTDVRPNIRTANIELKYFEGKPVIDKIQRVSKPGRRIYYGAGEKGVANGLGIHVLSTSHGVLSDGEAAAKGVGGEVICEVF